MSVAIHASVVDRSFERRAAGQRERCVLRRTLDNLIDVLSVSHDESSTRLALLTFARRCGFEHFAYVNVRSGDTEAFSSYPQEWQEIYFANKYHRVDPVITAAKRALRPFYWSAAPLRPVTSLDERQFYEQARRYGIVSGFSIPIRAGFNHTAVLTLASHLPEFKAEGTIDDMQAITATALVHAALRTRVTKSKPKVHLSAREKECLSWAAVGKSVPETAGILGIKECTVRYYLDEAKDKLGAYNTVNAVYLATGCGLI